MRIRKYLVGFVRRSQYSSFLLDSIPILISVLPPQLIFPESLSNRPFVVAGPDLLQMVPDLVDITDYL
jgi:hypothetical protein